MKKVLVVNDTSSEFHIGCLGVMKTIFDDIQEKWPDADIYTITTCEIKKAKNVKSVLDGVDFPDHVVVNGEGSMHTRNKEGEFIIQLVQNLSRAGVRSFVLLNASLYVIPKHWVKVLEFFSIVQVRDLRSLDAVSSVGVGCTFLPDRLFRFALEVSSDDYSERTQGVMLFDAVNRSHQDLLALIDLDETPIFYGSVDCSPFLTARVLKRDGGVFRYGLRGVFRFYLKVLRRLLVYRKLKGEKYITSLKFPAVTQSGNVIEVYAARYHIAVMCFSLGLNGNFFASNTPKIEALIDYVQRAFPNDVEINRSANGFFSVSWNEGVQSSIRHWVASFKYSW